VRKLATLYLFLPLIAYGMDLIEDPKDPTRVRPAGSSATLSDVCPEMRDERPASEVARTLVTSYRKRSLIRRTAVVPGGPLDFDALRKELAAKEGILSVVPVVAPLPTDKTDSSVRAQPSTTPVTSGVMSYDRKPKVRDPKGHPSSGVVQPPKWAAGLNLTPKQ
jgi:hypothetical protein